MPYRPFGDAPVSIPQEVRASPPNPSQANLPPSAPVAQLLANQMPVRASPQRPPTSNRQGLQTQRPFAPARVFQAGGMSGAPIQATNINGAPVAVDPVGRAGSLGAMNVDTSVSAQVRAAKGLRADGVPVTGAYTSAIRSAAGGFAPPRMPKQGYMAASYSYPSQAMVVGATLAGVPIVNAQPVMGVSPAPAPRLVVRERGQGPRNQVSSSPSEDRRRMLSTLQGLGGFGAINWGAVDITRVDIGKYVFDEETSVDGSKTFKCNTEQGIDGCRGVKVERVKKALIAAGKPITDEAVNYFAAARWSSISTLTGVILENWDAFLAGRRMPDKEYASSLSQMASNKKAEEYRKAVDTVTTFVEDKVTGSGGGATAAPPPPAAPESSSGGMIPRSQLPGFRMPALPKGPVLAPPKSRGGIVIPKLPSAMLPPSLPAVMPPMAPAAAASSGVSPIMIGVGVAALAAIAFVATRK